MVGDVLERIQDEESRSLLTARMQASEKKDPSLLYKTLISLKREDGLLPISENCVVPAKKDRLSALKRLVNTNPDGRPNIIVVGGRNETKGMMNNLGLKPAGYLHRERNWGIYDMDIPILTAEECIKRFPDAVYISENPRDKEFLDGLKGAGVSEENLYYYHSCWRSQYFDELFLKPDIGGVFVDCGAFDLNNTIDYIRWCKNDFEAVYAFEADKGCFKGCYNKLFSQDDDVRNKVFLYNAAVGDKEEETIMPLYKGQGENVVKKRRIDDILKGKRVSYLKMDIEGAELEALQGAAQSIRRWKPMLAICIYHKPEDVFEIPQYILSLVKDYRFYVRHYSTCLCETVLYAI